MNSGGSLNKILAFLFLISSVVNAYMISLLAFTYTTGDLPYGIVALMDKNAKKEKTEEDILKEQKEMEDNILRLSEGLVTDCYKKLKKREEEITRHEETISLETKKLNALRAGLDEYKKNLEKKLTEILTLVDKLDAAEIANVKSMGEMIAAAQPSEAAQMLLDLEQKTAIRILKNMDPKKRATTLSEIKKIDPNKMKNFLELFYTTKEIKE